jgi:hypothetical protein
MGDILTAIFGSSTQTNQQTTPDPIAQALNTERLAQLQDLFSSASLRSFGDEQAQFYSPTAETTALLDAAQRDVIDAPLDYSNLMSLDDYRSSFDPVTANYERSLTGVDRLAGEGAQKGYNDYTTLQRNLRGLTQGALERSHADYGTGTASAREGYNRTSEGITADYNAAIARGDFDYARAIAQSELNRSRTLEGLTADRDTSLATQEANRARALELGIGQTGNYIDQIATPRLNQALALQGLESGGAVPSSIARATAEYALPFLQSIENAYGSNVANTLAQYMQGRAGVGTNTQNVEASLGQSAAEGNRALSTAAMGQRATAGNTYQNNITQLAQALMANGITLEQAGISAESALGQQLMNTQNALRLQQQESRTSLANTYGGQAANFAASLPDASSRLSLLPGQMQTQRAANLTALQPLTDFSRQLQEANLLRRQGLFTTAYTGIPFTPGSTTAGGSATGNIFDQLSSTFESGVNNAAPPHY